MAQTQASLQRSDVEYSSVQRGCLRKESTRAARRTPYSTTASCSSCHSFAWKPKSSMGSKGSASQPLQLQAQLPHLQQLDQQQQKQAPPLHEHQALNTRYVLHKGVLVPVDACVTVAIKLCTRSMQNSLEAVKVAYAACTAGAHLPAAEWALSNAELLMTETIRRVRLALNLCKLAHTQHPTSIPVPQPAAAGSHDDSCLDTACSSCSPQKQTLFGHAEQQTQDAAVQAQMILLQIQQLQQQLSRRRQNMQQGPQPGELLQQQPDRAQCLTQAAQAQQWLQKQELQSALPLLAQQAVAAAVVHQDEVASSWE